MKVSKSSIAISLLLVITITLSACGGDPKSSNPNPKPPVTDCSLAKNAAEQKCIDEAAEAAEAARLAEEAKKTNARAIGSFFYEVNEKKKFSIDLESTISTPASYQLSNVASTALYPILFSVKTTPGQSEDDEFNAFLTSLQPFNAVVSTDGLSVTKKNTQDPTDEQINSIPTISKSYQEGNYLSIFHKQTLPNGGKHNIYKVVHDHFLIPMTPSTNTVYINKPANYSFATSDIIGTYTGDAYTEDIKGTNRAKGRFTLSITKVGKSESDSSSLAFTFPSTGNLTPKTQITSAIVSNIDFRQASDPAYTDNSERDRRFLDKLKGTYSFKSGSAGIQASFNTVNTSENCQLSNDCLSGYSSSIVFVGLEASHVGGEILLSNSAKSIYINFAGKKTTPTSTSE